MARELLRVVGVDNGRRFTPAGPSKGHRGRRVPFL